LYSSHKFLINSHHISKCHCELPAPAVLQLQWIWHGLKWPWKVSTLSQVLSKAWRIKVMLETSGKTCLESLKESQAWVVVPFRIFNYTYLYIHLDLTHILAIRSFNNVLWKSSKKYWYNFTESIIVTSPMLWIELGPQIC
jgi:hypothetical protein